MLDDLLGGFGGGGGSSKQLSSATASTTIGDPFGGGGGLDLSQIGPVLLAGLVVIAVMVVAVFSFRGD